MAAYIVTTLADENDGGAGGTGLSLREALALANADSGTADTITFAAGLASARRAGLVRTGDVVVMIGGHSLARGGSNLLQVVRVGPSPPGRKRRR